MKKRVLEIGDKLFIPTYIILICYFLYSEELKVLPFINFIRLIVVILPVFLCVCAILDPINKFRIRRPPVKSIERKNIVNIFSFYSEYIINYSFYLYFFLYIILGLDKMSVTFNYVLLLMFGIFLGYGMRRKKNEKSDSF